MRTTSRDARLHRIRTGFPQTQSPDAAPQDPLEDDADFVTSLDTAGGAMRPSAVPVSAQSGNTPRRRGTGLGAAQDLHRQRHRDHPGRPPRPDPGRTAHCRHGQGGRGHVELLLRPAHRLPLGRLVSRHRLLRRALPGRGLQPPGQRRRRTVRAADGNPHHRHPADHRRPRRRPGLPCGPVQHRCAGPDHHGRHPRRLGGLRAGPAGGAPPAARPDRRHRRRCRLGRPGRRAQGENRSP